MKFRCVTLVFVHLTSHLEALSCTRTLFWWFCCQKRTKETNLVQTLNVVHVRDSTPSGALQFWTAVAAILLFFLAVH